MNRTELDPRITDALQTIGAITEADEGVPYADIAQALTLLATIARLRGTARERRLAGDIVGATLFENSIDIAYGQLPAGAQW